MFSLVPIQETAHESRRPSPDLKTTQPGSIIEHRCGAISVVSACKEEGSVTVRCVFIQQNGKKVTNELNKRSGLLRNMKSVCLLRNGRVNTRRSHRFDAMGELIFIGGDKEADEFLENVNEAINTDRAEWGQPALHHEEETP